MKIYKFDRRPFWQETAQAILVSFGTSVAMLGAFALYNAYEERKSKSTPVAS
jgi:hypothetical protein